MGRAPGPCSFYSPAAPKEQESFFAPVGNAHLPALPAPSGLPPLTTKTQYRFSNVVTGAEMRFAAIADDLTGAVELASYLVREGVPARVLTSQATAEDMQGCPAPVFGLKVRTVPKRVALKRVARALDILRPFKPQQLFYKYCATFDSTPRGNIGPIADLLRRETGVDFTGFLPCLSRGGPNCLSRPSLRRRHA